MPDAVRFPVYCDVSGGRVRVVIVGNRPVVAG
jgi:hypothetical protein